MEVELLAVTPDAESVIERAGRTCYMSQASATETSSSRFIRMLVSRGHDSVLEHAYATFRIAGVSRATTHQIVRHRLCSFSQRSQRYVREGKNDFVMPPSIASNDEAKTCFEQSLAAARRCYEDLIRLRIPKEDARFVLPSAASSEIVISANFRELRHILLMRGSREAQWEIREVAKRILGIMKEEAPSVFFDLIVGSGEYVERQAQKTPA
jgi:thymidylate synthase (FAD)